MRSQSQTIKSNDPKRIEKLKKKMELLQHERKELRLQKQKSRVLHGVSQFDIDYKIKSIENIIRKTRQRIKDEGGCLVNKKKKVKAPKVLKNEESISKRHESLYLHWLYD